MTEITIKHFDDLEELKKEAIKAIESGGKFIYVVDDMLMVVDNVETMMGMSIGTLSKIFENSMRINKCTVV